MTGTLQVGLVGEAVRSVEHSMLASAVGSGSLDVLATPSLIALIEQAACGALDGHLPDSHTTVGVRIDVRHLAPTPPGLEVRARAELVELDGRKLVFRVEAFDVRERIAEGLHERALVDPERLLGRARSKLDSIDSVG
jgi:predicted thioesterase